MKTIDLTAPQTDTEIDAAATAILVGGAVVRLPALPSRELTEQEGDALYARLMAAVDEEV